MVFVLLAAQKNLTFPKRLEPIQICGALFVCFQLLYLVPIPLHLLDATRISYHNTVHDVLQSAQLLNSTQLKPLSLNAVGTWRFFIYVFSLWLLFSIVRANSTKANTYTLWVLFISLLLSTSAGIVSHYWIPQGKTILWIFSVPNGSPIGSFVNNNHYAYSCILLIGSALYLLDSKINAQKQDSQLRPKYTSSIVIICIIAVGIALTGLAISHSRSGLLACGSGILAAISFSILRINKTIASIAIGAGALFALVIMFYPSDELKERIHSLSDPIATKSGQTRINSWSDAIDVWQAFPTLGIGAESFRTTYPVFQTVNSRKTLLYAENEYVQSLTEFGILGLCILGGCLTLLLAPWITRNNKSVRVTSVIFIWLLSATLVQCIFDFPLRHPSNALALCLIIGLTLPLNHKEPRTLVKVKLPVTPKGITYSLGAIALIGIITQGKQLWQLDSGETLSQTNRIDISQALQNAPTFSYAWQLLGEQFNAESTTAKSTEQAFKLQDEALHCFHQAAIYNPSNYRQWRLLGQKALSVGDKQLATKAFEKAVQLRPYLKKDLEKQLRQN